MYVGRWPPIVARILSFSSFSVKLMGDGCDAQYSFDLFNLKHFLFRHTKAQNKHDKILEYYFHLSIGCKVGLGFGQSNFTAG